jgi:cysteine desulfurase
MTSPEIVYLDHAATTPMRRRAVEAMLPYLTDRFANPSGSHRLAREARRAVDDARDQVAAAVGCRPGEVVFTSGGTESDNAAIAGVVHRTGARAFCSAAEHHAVLHTVESLGGTAVAVDRYGHVDVGALTDATAARAGPPGAVVSVMAVNNEVGTISDLAAVRAAVPDAVLHTDAVQAVPWLDLPALWAHVDLLSLSAHKVGGPKGVGVLALRTGTAIAPLIVGGGQERDRRSGTHNVAGIVAMAAALTDACADRGAVTAAVGERRNRLVDAVTAAVDGVHETVPRDRKIPGSGHVLVEGVESEVLLYLLDDRGVCASAASACSSGAMEPSHVLAAMGVDPTLSRGALRLTLGTTTTDRDVERAADVLAESIRELRVRSRRGRAG